MQNVRLELKVNTSRKLYKKVPVVNCKIPFMDNAADLPNRFCNFMRPMIKILMCFVISEICRDSTTHSYLAKGHNGVTSVVHYWDNIDNTAKWPERWSNSFSCWAVWWKSRFKVLLIWKAQFRSLQLSRLRICCCARPH